MSGLSKAMAAQALVRAGAKYRPVYRVPRDANGVAAGEAARIGCILSVIYKPGQSSALIIDIPGIVRRAGSDHAEGIMTDGAPPPQDGDMVKVEGEMRTISGVSCGGDVLYTLTLSDAQGE